MRVHVLSGLCLGVALTSPAVAQTISKPDGAWRGAIGASYTSASGNNESTNASLFRAGVRYDLDFDDLKYGFVGFDSEKDKLADLKWRHSPSVGVGGAPQEQSAARDREARHTGVRGAAVRLGAEVDSAVMVELMIEQAKADWRSGRMKLPDLDHEEFIALP
jgi:hypothetical protein